MTATIERVERLASQEYIRVCSIDPNRPGTYYLHPSPARMIAGAGRGEDFCFDGLPLLTEPKERLLPSLSLAFRINSRTYRDAGFYFLTPDYVRDGLKDMPGFHRFGEFRLLAPSNLTGVVLDRGHMYSYELKSHEDDGKFSYRFCLEDCVGVGLVGGRLKTDRDENGGFLHVLTLGGIPKSCQEQDGRQRWWSLIVVGGENHGPMILDSIAFLNEHLSRHKEIPLWKAVPIKSNLI